MVVNKVMMLVLRGGRIRETALSDKVIVYMRHGLLEALAPEVPNERRPNTWLLELIALTDARFFTAVRLMVASIQMPMPLTTGTYSHSYGPPPPPPCSRARTRIRSSRRRSGSNNVVVARLRLWQ